MFTNGKPWVATQKDIDLRWGDVNSFRCRLCGHKFAVGDIVRWIYANGPKSPSKYGNFLTCQSCDGPDILEKAAAQEHEAKTRFWWLK